MILGRVYGSVYSTINHEFYDNQRLLLVEQLSTEVKASGKYLLAVDTVDAGAGEVVLVIDEGNSARQIVGDSQAPIRSIIVGIVDQFNVG